MKKTALIILPALLATPVVAQTALVDADGNGSYSYTEITATHPDVSEDDFAAMDADGNGELDEEELQAARDAGMLGG